MSQNNVDNAYDIDAAWNDIVATCNYNKDTQFNLNVSYITAHSGYQCGVLGLDGCIYSPPASTYNYIMKIDTSNDNITFFPSGLSASVDIGIRSGVLMPNGDIFFLPFSLGNKSITLKWDEKYTTPHVSDLSYSNAHGAVTFNGNIYYGGWKWGIRKYTYDTGAGMLLTSNSVAYQGAVLAPNKNVYLIAREGGLSACIDTSNDSVSTVSCSTTSTMCWGGCIAPTGFVYGIPRSGMWQKINTNNNTSTIISQSAAGNYACSGGVLLPNGYILAVPSNTNSLFYCDTYNYSVGSLGSISSGNDGYFGGILTPANKIYMFPYKKNNVCVLTITGLRHFTNNTCLSPFLNKF